MKNFNNELFYLIEEESVSENVFDFVSNSTNQFNTKEDFQKSCDNDESKVLSVYDKTSNIKQAIFVIYHSEQPNWLNSKARILIFKKISSNLDFKNLFNFFMEHYCKFYGLLSEIYVLNDKVHDDFFYKVISEYGFVMNSKTRHYVYKFR